MALTVSCGTVPTRYVLSSDGRFQPVFLPRVRDLERRRGQGADHPSLLLQRQ